MLHRRTRVLQAFICLTLGALGAYAESFVGPETDGTGQNCVKTTDSPTGPKCGPKVGVCCDAFDHRDNCLDAAGSSCASYGPHGNTPLTAFCCDQLDQPYCNQVNSASDCPSQDVQVYPNGNQYLECCARVGPVDNGYHAGLDCRNATNAARLASCGAERCKLFCCS